MLNEVSNIILTSGRGYQLGTRRDALNDKCNSNGIKFARLEQLPRTNGALIRFDGVAGISIEEDNNA